MHATDRAMTVRDVGLAVLRVVPWLESIEFLQTRRRRGCASTLQGSEQRYVRSDRDLR
jgi:hypothetical protein